MRDNQRTAPDRDIWLESFTAELTSAAYPLMLRRGLKSSWLEVELDLWWAISETVERWSREWPLADHSRYLFCNLVGRINRDDLAAVNSLPPCRLAKRARQHGQRNRRHRRYRDDRAARGFAFHLGDADQLRSR